MGKNAEPPRIPAGILGSAPVADIESGGEFELFEDSSLAGAETNRRTGAVDSTGGWDTYVSLPVGCPPFATHHGADHPRARYVFAARED